MPQVPEWERIETDTDKSWEAFVVYRDLGADRTLDKVAKVLGKSNGLIERWSQKHEWVRRAGLWDAQEDRSKQEGKLEDIRSMDRRHISIAQLFQQKVLDRIRDIDPEELTPNQLISWYEVAVRIERTARGKPSEILGGVTVAAGEIPPTLSRQDAEDVIELAKRMTGRGKKLKLVK